MKRQLQWLLCVVCTLGVSNIVSADISFSDRDRAIRQRAEGWVLLGQANSAKDPAEKVRLYGEAAANFNAAKEWLFEPPLGLVEGDRANLFYGAGLALNDQAGNVKERTEKIRLYRESAANFVEATKLYRHGVKERAHAFRGEGWALKTQADNIEEQSEKVRLYGEAAARFTDAVGLYGQGDERDRANALLGTGWALNGQASSIEKRSEKVRLYTEAAARFTDAIGLYGQGDEKDRTNALLGIGWALLGHANSVEERLEKVRLYGESVKKLIEVVNMADLNGQVIEVSYRAKALRSAGFALLREADNTEKLEEKIHLYGEAIKASTEAAQVYEQLGEMEEYEKRDYAYTFVDAGWALGNWADSVVERAERARLYDGAIEKFTKSLELHERFGDVIGCARAFFGIGVILRNEAKYAEYYADESRLYQEAKEKFVKSTKLYEQVKVETVEVKQEYIDVLNNIGWILRWQVKYTDDSKELARLYAEAKDVFIAAVKLCEQLADKTEEVQKQYADVLSGAGWALLKIANSEDQKERAEKIRLYEEAAEKSLAAAKLYKQSGEEEKYVDSLRDAIRSLQEIVDNISPLWFYTY